jgi:Mg-chelatase subunit ChlD
MTRSTALLPTLLLLAGLPLAAAPAAAEPELRVEILEPSPETVLLPSETSVRVRGGASIYGGVRYLDLFLVMDTSKSLRQTDPRDHRSAGAIGLVRSLPARSDIRLGLVDFDGNTEMLSGLTPDREAIVALLETLDQNGTTDLAEGIRTALRGFGEYQRPDVSRVILLFTDGRSDRAEARAAMDEARRRGVAIHTLLLGADDEGEAILREIADGTRGSFVRVTDPEKLPEAFLQLRTTGVESVVLRSDGGAPIPARLTGGSFEATVPIRPGRNRIIATAVSLDGEIRQAEVAVKVRGPGCAELSVAAERGGQPALSISDRDTLLLLDASNSMWGRMDGEPKMEVARRIVSEALDWIPADLNLGLRVYGHRQAHARRDCADSELLVPFDSGSREQIRQAIGQVRPRGQTPLAYALGQAARDLRSRRGERAVILVTDGIESCGGDPAAAARALQALGPVPVHVIGFGLGDGESGDPASLAAIAEASGGRFLLADSAEALRDALSVTVGTPFEVRRGEAAVARSNLGADDEILLPEGDYTLRVESAPPYEIPISLASDRELALRLERNGDRVRLLRRVREIGYRACPAALPADVSPGAAAPGPGD